MGKNFESLKNTLYDEISSIVYIEDIPKDFNEQFMELVNGLNFMLIHDKDNFFGYKKGLAIIGKPYRRFIDFAIFILALLYYLGDNNRSQQL